ncbi:MAG: hypothetical protein IKW47_02510 [Alistipes sp.]|nr:hypothetical protein [Alistipes sp.]
MAHMSFTVDTQPMAREIESVSQKVKGTTNAIVGMRAAVVAAEAEAADHVCNNVNRGFYTLIHSQISQKIARLQSDVDSHLMKLNQCRKQLLGVKSRMERDYGMITGRYTKLFNGINKNLELRVYELDKPTFNFAIKDTSAMNNRTAQLTATVPVSQLELLTASQRIIASNMKYRCQQVVSSVNNFLSQMKDQDRLTERILLPQSVEKDTTAIMVPIIISESNYDAYNHMSKEVAINESSLTPRGREAIRKGGYEAEVEWQTNDAISNELKSEFQRCLSQSSASSRVKDMAQKLFMANNFQTLK